VYYNSFFKLYIHTHHHNFLETQPKMGGRQPSGDTPPDISQNPAITPKLEINDSPMSELQLFDS